MALLKQHWTAHMCNVTSKQYRIYMPLMLVIMNHTVKMYEFTNTQKYSSSTEEINKNAVQKYNLFDQKVYFNELIQLHIKSDQMISNLDTHNYIYRC